MPFLTVVPKVTTTITTIPTPSAFDTQGIIFVRQKIETCCCPEIGQLTHYQLTHPNVEDVFLYPFRRVDRGNFKTINGGLILIVSKSKRKGGPDRKPAVPRTNLICLG
jgi:hypothetical protein